MTNKDESLMRMARNRVEFRRHLIIYVLVNSFLVALNLIYSPQFFWAIFPLVFWGVGLFSHYRDAYHGDFEYQVEKEYHKLKARQKGK